MSFILQLVGILMYCLLVLRKAKCNCSKFFSNVACIKIAWQCEMDILTIISSLEQYRNVFTDLFVGRCHACRAHVYNIHSKSVLNWI